LLSVHCISILYIGLHYICMYTYIFLLVLPVLDLILLGNSVYIQIWNAPFFFFFHIYVSMCFLVTEQPNCCHIGWIPEVHLISPKYNFKAYGEYALCICMFSCHNLHLHVFLSILFFICWCVKIIQDCYILLFVCKHM